MNGIFLSWSRGHGRTSDLADAFALNPEFVYLPGPGGLIGRYWRQFRATRNTLRTHRPNIVWVQLPPAVALLSFIGLRGYRPLIVADLHTGFFLNPVWRWASGISLRWLRRRQALAIVTNEHLARQCTDAGVRTLIMHDLIIPGDPLPNAGHVLCPLSYANDEPVPEILAAAALTPQVSWILTGNAPEHVTRAAPPNVKFTGFISDDAYRALLRSAAMVCALTTRPHTMQRAGYEAIEYGVPLVTSDFPELRHFFGDAAVYAAPEQQSIAAQVTLLHEDNDAYRALMRRQQAHAVNAQRNAQQSITQVVQARVAPQTEQQPPAVHHPSDFATTRDTQTQTPHVE